MAKWSVQDGLASDEVPADAVTSDLRTTRNTLSFWSCLEASEGELGSVVLALATPLDRVEKIDLVWLEQAALDAARLVREATQGDTPVASLRERHRDITHLDYVRLGRVAALVQEAVANGRCRRFSKRQVVDLIRDAIGRGLVQAEDLAEKVRADVQKAS